MHVIIWLSYGFSSSSGYESWIIKKAECWRTDAFKLWCYRRLLRVPWTVEIKPVNPKGNQPQIFTGRTVAEAEAPISWLPDAKSRLTGKDWCWERLKAKGEGGSRVWNGWVASLTQWTWIWANCRGQWKTEEVAKSQTWLSNWTTTTIWMRIIWGAQKIL